MAVMAGEISLAVILSVVPGADFSWPRYAALLGAFLVFQRGSRVAAADRDQRVAAVRWGTLLAVLSLALSAWLNPQPHPAAPLLTAVLPVLLLLQLGEPPRRAAAPPAVARRSVLITMAIGVLTLPIGLLAAAFADAVELQTAAAEGLRLLLVPIALIGAWLARLINDYLAGPLTAFFSLFAVRLRFGQTQATESDGQQFAPLTEAVDGATAERFADLLLALLILLPLVLLVLMVVVLRRRRRPPENGEELRRSLGVGSLLAQDLRGHGRAAALHQRDGQRVDEAEVLVPRAQVLERHVQRRQHQLVLLAAAQRANRAEDIVRAEQEPAKQRPRRSRMRRISPSSEPRDSDNSRSSLRRSSASAPSPATSRRAASDDDAAAATRASCNRTRSSLLERRSAQR
jgi:hypothetical protein